MKKLIALCSAALLLASCTKRIDEGFGGTGDPVQVELGFTVEEAASAVEGGEATKVYESEAMKVVFSSAAVDPEATKASVALTNVWVIQFDAAGNFVTAHKTPTLAVGANLTPVLRGGKSQRLYVVAAMHNTTDFSTALAGKTIDDFRTLAGTLDTAPNMTTAAGIPLCSDEVTADIYSNGKFFTRTGIKLKRVVAQILFTAKLGANTTAAEKYTITSVRLVNRPKNIYFALPAAGTATYPEAVAANFENVAATAGVTAQQNWFVPDNVRGTITNSDRLKKVPGALGDFCTYVEIQAERVALGQKKLATMKVYLGSNMTDNFNIERNKIYTITCTVNDFEVAGDERVEITVQDAPLANCYMIVPGTTTPTYIPVKRANEIYTPAMAALYGLTSGTAYQGGTEAQENYNGPSTASWVVTAPVYNPADSLPEMADKRVWIAEIAWQDTNASGADGAAVNGVKPLVIIENPIITNRRDVIRVRANGHAAGNCIIRLRRAKTAAGANWDNQTVWTWHLWVTSYQPGDANSSREPGTVPGSSVAGTGNDGKAAVHTYTGWLNNDPGTESISGGVKHPIMDRNLGAMSASPGVASYGLLYQWGRKDPFVGSRDGLNGSGNGATFYVPAYNNDTESRSITAWTSYNTIDGAAAGNTGKGDLGVRKVNSMDLGNTIFSAIRNPGTFYFVLVTSNRNWTSPNNDALWQDEVKTLFDPCPAGWRVPRGGKEKASPWYNFVLEPNTGFGGGIPNAVEKETASHPDSGYHFYCFGTSGMTCWYPHSGFREPDGIVKYSGRASLLWTTTRMDETRMHDLYSYMSGVRCWGGDVNGYGNSVRCVRE